MKKYQYPSDIMQAMESCCIPFAVYQFLNRRVVTIMLSDGFLKLFGLPDRAAAYELMDSDMYRDAHPDDVPRIADAAVRFATDQDGYNVVYRTKTPDRQSYLIVHAHGEHVMTEDGTRLAFVWYTDEGSYVADSGAESTLPELYSRVLRDESVIHRASYSYLTGLPNMGYFLSLAEAGRRHILESGGRSATLFFDVNGMRNYNRRYGYAEGDALLREIAGVLKRHFSAENCGHVGQDGFVVYTAAEGLEAKLRQIFADCAKLNGGKSRTIRAGVYVEDAEPLSDSATAVDRAKLACSAIRGTMRSIYRFFDEKMLSDTADQQYVVENLDQALREGWIRVFYQPVVRSSTGRVCNEEALARWIDPERGVLMPNVFIPILEKYALIYRLDLYILEQVLENMRRKREAGLYVVPVSVNLSRSDFESCDIVKEIRTRVDTAGVDRGMIMIEITESMVGRDPVFMKEQIERFHRLGFRVWMDDFGSGYSSLELLQSIDFDLIKFDMHFMRQFESSEKSRRILMELMRMALSIGTDTLVEGVETLDQADFLKRIGCDKVQGFLYARPIPLDDLLRLYEQGRGIRQEDPAQAAYYTAVGTANLNDPSTVRGGMDTRIILDAVPMAVLEKEGDCLRLLRCNQSYSVYLSKFSPDRADACVEKNEIRFHSSSMHAMAESCMETEEWITEERSGDRTGGPHAFARRIAVNPVTGAAAIVHVILAMM